MSSDDSNPSLEELIQRVLATPEEFQLEPLIAAHGQAHVPALVHDLYLTYGLAPRVEFLMHFQSNGAGPDRNRLKVVMVMIWLLTDAWLVQKRLSGQILEALLRNVAEELASQTSAHALIHDADRREELVRLCISHLGFRPSGETVEQAADRLARISSMERQRLLTFSRAAEERARAIREALLKKAAEASADKWGRD